MKNKAKKTIETNTILNILSLVFLILSVISIIIFRSFIGFLLALVVLILSVINLNNKNKISIITLIGSILMIGISIYYIVISSVIFLFDKIEESQYKSYQESIVEKTEEYILDGNVNVNKNNLIINLELKDLIEKGYITRKNDCDGYINVDLSDNKYYVSLVCDKYKSSQYYYGNNIKYKLDLNNYYEDNGQNEDNFSNIKYIWCNKNDCDFDNELNSENTSDYKLISFYECKNKNSCYIKDVSINNNKILIKDEDEYFIYDLNTKEKLKATVDDYVNYFEYKEENLDNKNLNDNIFDLDEKYDESYHTSPLNNNQTFLFDESYEDDNHNKNNLNLVFENNKLYFKVENEREEVNIKNIKKIYIINGEYFSAKYIYILTNDGSIYFLYYDLVGPNGTLNKLANSFEKIESKHKYVKLYHWYMGSETYDYAFSVLGEDNSGNKYIIGYDELPFNDVKINYWKYIITKDNYLYLPYDKVDKSKKVVKVMSKEIDNMINYIIFFNNGETFVIEYI